MGVPPNRWFTMENGIKRDDVEGPIFQETSIWGIPEYNKGVRHFQSQTEAEPPENQSGCRKVNDFLVASQPVNYLVCHVRNRHVFPSYAKLHNV